VQFKESRTLSGVNLPHVAIDPMPIAPFIIPRVSTIIASRVVVASLNVVGLLQYSGISECP